MSGMTKAEITNHDEAGVAGTGQTSDLIHLRNGILKLYGPGYFRTGPCPSMLLPVRTRRNRRLFSNRIL